MIIANWTSFRHIFAAALPPLDPDGIEQWPLGKVRETGSGFGDLGSTLTGIPTPFVGLAFNVTCNALANDTVAGVDQFDWYLSQRTDDAAFQLLTISTFNPGGGNTASGTVTIFRSALSVTEVGPVTAQTPGRVVTMFRDTYLYVQRRSDDAIQWVDLLRAQVASYP